MNGHVEPTALVRAVLAVSAARRAGLAPVRVEELHVLAYLARALSPVWSPGSTAGEVLKRSGLPYLPDMGRALDELIFAGLLEVTTLRGDVNDGVWRQQIDLTPSEPAFGGFLARIRQFPEERDAEDFLLEIALGIARTDDLKAVFMRDASYSDPSTSVRQLISFEEDVLNPSAAVAEFFDEVDPAARLSRATKIGLYLNLLDSMKNAS